VWNVPVGQALLERENDTSAHVIGPLFKAARIALPPNVRDASAA